MKIVLTVLSLLLTFALSADDKQKPNILYIMSDDHSAKAISAYGGILSKVAPTPNIDRIAKEGMLMKNCFATNSICTPSRASIFTGKYSHKNGVYQFTALDQSQTTLPKLMHKNGYHTAFIGKWHLHSNPIGFDHWSLLPGQGRYINPQFIEMGGEHKSGRVARGKRTTHKGHSSDVIANKTLDYLKNKREPNKPFMLFCHFKAPHDWFVPAPRYNKLFEEVTIPEPSNLFDNYSTRSQALKQTLQYIGHWDNGMSFEKETKHIKNKTERFKAQYQIYMKRYLRCVRGIDDNIKRILDYLDESGLSKNTLVVYTADQGFFLGQHRLYDKRFMYEESLRMPMLVRWPGKIKPGSTSDDIAVNIDFAPSLLKAAGIKVPEEMQGESLVPVWQSKTPQNWRTSMYYRYYVSHFKTPAHYGVRTKTHKLICFQDIPNKGEQQWELYNLMKDRSEMNNLYSNPEYSEVIKTLKTEITRLQKYYGDNLEDMGKKPRPKFITE